MAKVSTSATQRKLLVIWLVFSAFPFLIMAIQTMMEKFGNNAQEAWAWLLPTVMPTLVLVIGTVVTNGIQKPHVDKKVDEFFWKLAAGLSVFYLLLVLVTLIMTSMKASPIAAMIQSNLFLAPLQGLVGAALGVFFVSGTPASRDGT